MKIKKKMAEGLSKISLKAAKAVSSSASLFGFGSVISAVSRVRIKPSSSSFRNRACG